MYLMCHLRLFNRQVTLLLTLTLLTICSFRSPQLASVSYLTLTIPIRAHHGPSESHEILTQSAPAYLHTEVN